jgi:type I restriction enzyme M protein
MLDIKTLGGWLWDAACKIRGPVDAPKFKDHILPLIFLKRLSDVFDEEIEKLAFQYGDKATVEELVEADHSIVWFYMPKAARWSSILTKSTGFFDSLKPIVLYRKQWHISK